MDKRVVILVGAAAIAGALIGFTLGSSTADSVAVDAERVTALLQELEAAAYQPRSEAWVEALQKTRAYLQDK